MRRTTSHRVRLCRTGGASPTVVIAASAGLLLIAAVLWFAWPRAETPAQPHLPRNVPTPIEQPAADVNEPQSVEDVAAWPESETSDEIREPTRRDSDERHPRGPIEDEGVAPREPASPLKPELEP